LVLWPQGISSVSPEDKQMPIWLIGKTLKSPVSSNDALPPDLSEKILQCILNGSPYPRYRYGDAAGEDGSGGRKK
jgi:hypothetical protein